jgi:hypothetical protein
MARADKWSALEAYVSDLALLLDLSGWEITISREPSEPDAHADIDPHAQRRSAELRVESGFYALSPERQRLTIAHELGHLIHARVDRVVENLEETLGKVGWSILEPNYVDAAERTVEHWARLVAPSLPLPSLPRG